MDNTAQSSIKRDGIPPEREAKRLRPTEIDNSPTLSPELQAQVLEFVPFETVLACGATCRSMLHETMPLIKTIHIDKPQQMNLTVASRFRDIKTMYINSLLSTSIGNEGGDDEYTHVNINLETKIRVVPFISQFALLELVHFGGKDDDGNIIEGFSPTSGGYGEVDEPYPNESSQESMLSFIDMLSGGYSTGVLKQHLTISGLCCPAATNNRDTNTCRTCIRACKSFPLQSIIQFESRGSSSNNARSGRLFCLDVCLDRVHIDSITESRPGGNKLLHSHKRLLQLLSSGRRHEITADDEPTLYIVKYKEDDLDEMKRVIKYAGLNIKHLSMQMVSSAVMKSFTKVNSSTPSKNQRYLSEESLDYLVNEIGLPIDREDFELSSADLLEHIQQIISALQHRADLLDSDEEEDPESLDIDLDCLRLVYRLLTVEAIPPIYIPESVIHLIEILVPLLVMYLQPDIFDDSFMLEASKCLKCIITRGTDEHRKMILGADGIHDFSQLLDSSNDKINKVVVSSLVELVLPPKGSDEDIKTMSEAGAIPRLVGLLDSRHDGCVENALRLLVAAKDHIKTTVYRPLLPQIIKLIRSYKFFYWNYQANQSNDKKEYLTNCSALLRMVIGRGASIHLRQIAIDSMAIPTLLDVLQLANDDAVKLDLEHVILNILTYGTKKQVENLLKEAGVLDLLISLVTSEQDDISPQKAIEVIGKIADDMADDYFHCVCQARIVESLLQVLGNTRLGDSTLQAAAEILPKFCPQPMDIATTKKLVMVLSRLLSHENEFIVADSCMAMCHILSGLTGKRVGGTMNTGELNQVVNVGLIKQLLTLVSKGEVLVQQPALALIHLLSWAGDVKAITLNNGIVCLSKALSSRPEDANQERMIIVKKKIQRLVCGTISNIITNDTDQIQTAIDNNTVPCLIKMLEGDTASNKDYALKVIHQMTKAGSNTQIKYLVSQDCIHHLCELLTTSDCDIASTALSAIHDIFKVGRDEQNKLMDEESNNIQEVKSKLDELTDEMRQIKLETERVTEYKQRQAWLLYHEQKEKSRSLIDAIELMKDQHQLSQSRSYSYSDKVAEVGADTPLGKTYHRLHVAEHGLKEGLEKEIRDTGRELSLAETKLEQLLSDTNESTSEEKQNEHIANLSEEIASNANALETAKSNLDLLMNGDRISPERKTNLAVLEDGIRQLFKGVSIRRLMKVVFVPLRTSEVANHARDVEFTFKICKDSKLKALRAYIVEMARKHYVCNENELKKEDVQLADIWSNKVWSFLNDMDSSIDSIKARDVTYAYQMYPLDKVQKESIVHKAKKEREDQAKKRTSSSKEGNSSDDNLTSRSLLSQTGELDPLTKADLDIGDRWTVALEKYLGQPMTLSRLTATARATDQERSQFYLQLLRFISKCKDCSDAKPPEEGKKSNEEDGKVTLEEASHMSQQFKNVNTPKDLAIFEYCMGKFREMMSERKKKDGKGEEETKKEDGVIVQIQIRKSDTSTSHYGHNPYSSSSGQSKTSWKLVGEAPIVARISPTLSVSGLREMLGRRLACGPLKLNSDEHHSNGDDSLPSPELSIMNQVALSWEEKANSRFGLAALGTVTLDQLAENPQTPVFASPSDKEEKELVTEIVDDGCIIVVDWPIQLNSNLDGDALSAAQDRVVVADDGKIVEVSSGIV